MIEEKLFVLLRLGLGISLFAEENVSDFLHLSPKQWELLSEMALEQGVSAIALDGLQVIMDELGTGCFSRGENRDLWQQFKLQWVGCALKYEDGNKLQLSIIGEVQKKWAVNGIRMMLMKGTAMGTYYPNPIHRSPGDIDCFLFEDYAKGNETAKTWAEKVDEGWYKHSQIFYRGQLIENHQYFVHTREGRSSKRLESVLLDTLKVDDYNRLPGTDVLLPPPMFNALFLTYHALSHFLEEGLKLKQILDWAMFLKRDADKVDWTEFYRICNKFHLHRFVDVCTDIAVHRLGVKIVNSQIIIDSPYTQKVLHSTLYDKDYVFSSEEGGWTNRWHIVKNLFKYRWKFHEIYRHTVIRQLWFYATGYLFKTE